MSEPPLPSLSQPPAHSVPLFHHPNGTHIQVFVEAGGIFNRPKLIRNLKRHDAAICSDPRNADIILVDTDTWQGKEFIREWGKDQNKVVLGYAWVRECVSAKKVLLAQDNWGGCLTHDDGLPITRPVKGDDGEVVIKSPLPTPRETPTESALPLKRHVPSHKPPEVATKRRSPDRMLPPVNTAAGPPESAVSPLNAFSPLLLPPYQYQPQPGPVVSPPPTDPTSVFMQQQSAPPVPAPFGIPNAAMPPLNMNMSMMPFNPQLVTMFAQQQQQQQLGMNGVPMGTQPTSVAPENFATALMDIMKMYGAASGGMPVGQWPSNFVGMTPTQTQQPQQSGAGSGSAVQEGSSESVTTGRRDTRSPSTAPLPSMPQSPSVLHAPIKRKWKEDVIEFDLDDEEDEPLLASSAKGKKRKEQKPKQKGKEKERRSSRGSLSYSAPSRNPYESQSQTPKTGADTDSLGKLFVNAEGKPMQFFVQVDLKGRVAVTRAIKKNGGLLTSEVATADYAVLYSRSTTFKELLSTASVCQTPAVTFHFVFDAVSQGSIPENLANYLFDAKQNLVKKKAAFDNSAIAETKRLEKNAKQADRAAKQRDMAYNYIARSRTPDSPSTSMTSTLATVKRSDSPVSNSVHEQPSKGKEKAEAKRPPVEKTAPATPSSAAVVPRPKYGYYYPKERTPTPPPTPETGWERSSWGYSYTPPERVWAEKYLLVLYKRDPLMSQTAVAKALNRKLGHHSAGSWSTFLGSQFRAEFELCKKRGGIAHRKEKSQWEEEERKRKQLEEEKTNIHMKQEDGVKEELSLVSMTADQLAQTTDVPMEYASIGQSDGTGEKDETRRRQDEEEDLNDIARFFAYDGGDEGTEPEEEVWAKLERRVKCRTAGNWDEFYTQHHEEVLRRYNKMMNEKANEGDN